MSICFNFVKDLPYILLELEDHLRFAPLSKFQPNLFLFMMLRFIIFISLTCFFLFGAHYLLYKSMVQFFLISQASLKWLLFYIILFLALSFIAAVILLNWKDNWITTGFYLLAATWLGLLINLLLAVGLSWVIIWIARMFQFNPHTPVMGAVICFLAVIYSIYGLWNAFTPEIKNLDFRMENLPDHWDNKKIVHLSDIHLGHIQGLVFLENVIKKVNAQEPELILITGDLFDGMARNFSQFVQPLNRLNAKKGVYFVTGNHEIYIGLKLALETLARTDIIVLDNKAVEIDGLQIIGVSYPGVDSAHKIQNLASMSTEPLVKKPKILLFHTPTNLRIKPENTLDNHFNNYWRPDTSMALNKEIGVDLQLSGHTHAGQIFPFNWLTKFIYQGYDYGLHREGDFSIYVTSGVGTWGPPLRTGTSPEIVVIRLQK